MLLTAHTPGFGPEHLADVLAAPFGVSRARIDRGPLQVTARTGATLEHLGFARWPGAMMAAMQPADTTDITSTANPA